MDCGATISFDSLLRRVLRFDTGNPQCAAVQIEEGIFNAPLECGADGLLTQYGHAITDANAVRISYTQGGTIEPIDCDGAPPSLWTLAAQVLGIADGGGTLIEVRERLPSVEIDCDLDCDDDMHIGTLERVLRSFVKVDGGNTGGFAVQVMTVSKTEEMSCDRILSLNTLVRMALSPMGDGTYAWRITL